MEGELTLKQDSPRYMNVLLHALLCHFAVPDVLEGTLALEITDMLYCVSNESPGGVDEVDSQWHA